MSTPTIGLALGGGAARGLAHIPVLEAFDDLGIQPAVIVGSSMGALIGAAYASGIAAAQIRAHALEVLGNPRSAARRILTGGERSPLSLLNFSLSRPVMIDGAALARLILPKGTANRVEETAIPFMVTATDFHAASEILIREGGMEAAVAASIAIPGVIAAPMRKGRLLIDGAITNPVPFDHVRAFGCDIVVAVEVTGMPAPSRKGKRPGVTSLALGATQIMQLQIAALKRRLDPPDIWIDPPVDAFRAHDFFKAEQILQDSACVRDETRQQLTALMEKAFSGEKTRVAKDGK